MVSAAEIKTLGKTRGWSPYVARNARKIVNPTANYIFIKQRRRRGFRTAIICDRTPKQVARRMKLRHERMFLIFLGSLFIQGGQAFEQGPQLNSLVNSLVVYPGLMSLANLALYPQPSSAGGPTTPKFFAISEINAHGPGDTHVSISKS